jgi:hypothetical protein
MKRKGKFKFLIGVGYIRNAKLSKPVFKGLRPSVVDKEGATFKPDGIDIFYLSHVSKIELNNVVLLGESGCTTAFR